MTNIKRLQQVKNALKQKPPKLRTPVPPQYARSDERGFTPYRSLACPSG